jgi:hypothetical protein
VFALLAHSSVQNTATSAPIQQVAFLTECVIHNQLVPHINGGEFPIKKTKKQIKRITRNINSKNGEEHDSLIQNDFRVTLGFVDPRSCQS